MVTPPILPKPVTSFIAKLQNNGFETYLVGGAVRHLLMGKETDNWDFTTNATPEQIQGLFPHNFYNNDYGTVSIPVADTSEVKDSDTSKVKRTLIFEITPYRRESHYTDKRHPEKIEWSKSLEEDLARRDFTINAIAYDGKKIIDPFDGQSDLKKKMIRAVGDPDTRFAEDALRLMRAVRLAAQLGFLIEDTTRESIKKNAELIEHVSNERKRDELFKILSSKNPGEGILFLKNTGLLNYILPEVEASFAIPQKSPKRHHVFDVGTHLIQALNLCPSEDIIVRLATLLHDIGKVETYKKDEETELITFFNHEIIGAKQAEKIADRLRLSKKEKDRLVTLVRFHMFTVSEKQTDKAIRRFIRNVGKEYLFDALDLRVADRLGSGAKLTSWRTELFKKRLEEVQQEPFSIKDLKIDGNDVMKTLSLKPGPKIGEILTKIFKEVEEGKVKNEREMLLEALAKIGF